MRKEWPDSHGELLPTDVVDTESNLNSRVLKRITATIDIDYTHFETKEKLIDESLLKMRNLIAHGDRISVPLERYEIVEKEIRELIDCFQQLVEQCVQQERYRAIDNPAAPAPNGG
jgi:RiboL-PSP-HEPN